MVAIMKHKKVFTLALIGVFAFILASICSAFNSHIRIEDAIVNCENGDIAFVYYNEGGMRINVYDYEGNQLWGRHLPSNGGNSAYLAYNNGNLVVYVSRTNKLYTFDRNGTIVEEADNVSHGSEQVAYITSSTWKNWKQDANVFEYYLEQYNTNYVYYASSSLRKSDKNCLFIESSNGEKIMLYEGVSGGN